MANIAYVYNLTIYPPALGATQVPYLANYILFNLGNGDVLTPAYPGDSTVGIVGSMCVAGDAYLTAALGSNGEAAVVADLRSTRHENDSTLTVTLLF
jgi:hypothetical protein